MLAHRFHGRGQFERQFPRGVGFAKDHLQHRRLAGAVIFHRQEAEWPALEEGGTPAPGGQVYRSKQVVFQAVPLASGDGPAKVQVAGIVGDRLARVRAEVDDKLSAMQGLSLIHISEPTRPY